jgi:alpha-N-arabinofuranosidase
VSAGQVVAEIDVDTTPLFSYDRNIFGQFVEHFHREIYGGIYDPGSPLADERGFRTDVLDALRALQVPVVRWPGGSFASGYHWKNAVGPDRTAVFDRAWRVREPNRFGTDEFLAWTAELGAQAYICTNAGTGTLDEMSDWVEYCNAPTGTQWADRRATNGRQRPYGVRYWSVGNENYEERELGAEDPEAWARRVTEAAKIMRRVDPTIRLLAASNGDPQWTLPMLRAAGKYLDYISVHRYWDALANHGRPAGYLGSMAHTVEPERTIVQLIALLEVAAAPHISIAFDEWNLRGWHHPEGNGPEAIGARDLNDDNSTYTMADAIFAASFLNACIRHGDRVRMANFAPAVNARGPLFVHEDGIVKRSTYHVFEMYVWLLQTHTLPALARTRGLDADGTEVPLIDVVATGNPESGALSIALLNKSPDSASPVRLRVNGALAADSAMVTVLGAAAPDAFNDVAHPRRRAPAHQHDQNHRRPYHSRPPQTAKGSAGPLVPQARTPRGETVPEG